MVRDKTHDIKPEDIKEFIRDHTTGSLTGWLPNVSIIELETQKIMLEMLNELKAIHELLKK